MGAPFRHSRDDTIRGPVVDDKVATRLGRNAPGVAYLGRGGLASWTPR
jgi:hypothetical protein